MAGGDQLPAHALRVPADDDADRTMVNAFLATRDEAAFRRLYARHAPALYLLALRLTGGAHSDAQDAVQEAWMRAATRLGGFRWASSLRTWLCGITVNCCREIVRERGAPDALEERDVEVAAPPAGVALDLEQLVRRLPAECRQVLVLHDLEGYTHAEVGLFLGIEVGTSKHQLFRARRRLRAWLSGSEESR
jgi:RNA polymerase sigma-70 factor, ECF subfamily